MHPVTAAITGQYNAVYGGCYDFYEEQKSTIHEPGQ